MCTLISQLAPSPNIVFSLFLCSVAFNLSNTNILYQAPAPSSPTVPFSEPPDPIVFQFQAIALTF
jgi:hypothetical protein